VIRVTLSIWTTGQDAHVITRPKFETYFKDLTIEELKAGSTGSYGQK